VQRRVFLAGAAAWGAMPAVLRAAEPGVGETEIVLGHTGIHSGPLGVPVKAFLAGAQMAFDDINAGGGVAGRRLKLVTLDDELKPDLAVDNCRRLLDEHKVFAFFGNVGSGTTAAVAPLLKDSGAPLVGAYAVADSAREKAAGAAYFVRATTGREAQVLVQHLTTIGIRRIGAAYLDVAGGHEAYGHIQAALKVHGLEPHASAPVKGDGSNVAEAARILAERQPQAVIMYLAGALPGELMKATWAQSSGTSFYGMSIVAGEVTAKVLDRRSRGLAISQVMPYPWGEVEPVIREYRQAADKAKVAVGYNSLEGFLNARLLIEALRRTGRELTRARLHATLRGLRMRMAGMDLDFTGSQSTGSRFVELVQVTHEGRFVR
jgi:branched-chain amino acid transport system substrate-binding protein